MKQYKNSQYYITDKLEVYNVITKRFVKPYLASNGRTSTKKYLALGLYINGKKKNVLYHRMLAEVLLPNPNNLSQVNHIDGNIINNSICNLEWCSAKDNNIHAIKSGLRPTKLNMEKANDIRKLLANGTTIKEICSLYSVGRNIVSKIRDNISWKI
jgi:hypothetical protein